METSRSGNIRTNSIATSAPTRTDDKLISFRYEDCIASKPPIPVTVAPPRAPPNIINPALRERGSSLVEKDASKRDSGLAPTTSSKAREGSVNTDEDSVSNFLGVAVNFGPSSQPTSTNLSQVSEIESTATSMSKSESVGSGSGSRSKWKISSKKDSIPQTPPAKQASTSTDTPFSITTAIPNESLMEDDFLDRLSFSKRGSVMLGGKKVVNGHERVTGGRR